MLDLTRVLSKQEITSVLTWLHHRRRRGPNVEINRTVFRLSCCCGLRCLELVSLNMGDTVTTGDRPYIRIRKTGTKGRHNISPSNPTGKDYRKARKVPLWWDAGTYADVALQGPESLGYRGRPLVAIRGQRTSGRRQQAHTGRRSKAMASANADCAWRRAGPRFGDPLRSA
jgi:integrase